MRKLLNKRFDFELFDSNYTITVGEIALVVLFYTLICTLFANFILISNF